MEESFYAEHVKIYPAAVTGTYRRIKWTILALWLGFYFLLPFVRWHRGEGLPDQAVLLDLPGRRFYFFFIEIWPQEVYYFTGLLIIAAFTLFLMTAVAGRVWCGYLCPQTVWTDLFLGVERLIEGDRRERIQLDEGPTTVDKALRKTAKWLAWLVIGVCTGGAWVLYFADAPTLIGEVFTGRAGFVAYLWIGILTLTTYAFAGYMREQMCIYACPWPRIQAALTDEWALNVSYRTDRGEPRARFKEAARRRERGEPAGDCVDCYKCVAVCPTGTDIRLGSQLSCIQCGLCIDACDETMTKLGRETRLIAYDTTLNMERRAHGLPAIFKPIRPRTLLYAALIAITASIMLVTFVRRGFEGVNILHDRNPLYVVNSDGSVRNGYTVRLLNRAGQPRTFELSVEGTPPGTRIEAVGITESRDGRPVIAVGADRTREIRVAVVAPPDSLHATSTDVVFRIVDVADRTTAAAKDFFKAP
ncbi:cytochrome c oxidase accessory protein CcoG [Siculibacillus lacustris]|uniref:Cytochrome c oxidase accessory protein CcoG n=2 Tax=Siculibacillus lacustris TaxID=1549641 RepID=A0A4Q9VST5_9HYPH|nr:cytochrome c oxidase accessory protein CcoG [Siculibacillus lacustris]TBW39067.1 cytochrome c oxidase accessory protein CcoG [Siculibacillus lacustris]